MSSVIKVNCYSNITESRICPLYGPEDSVSYLSLNSFWCMKTPEHLAPGAPGVSLSLLPLQGLSQLKLLPHLCTNEGRGTLWSRMHGLFSFNGSSINGMTKSGGSSLSLSCFHLNLVALFILRHDPLYSRSLQWNVSGKKPIHWDIWQLNQVNFVFICKTFTQK